MKVTTKALATVMLVTMLALTSATGVSATGTAHSQGDKREDRKLARLIKRHDRKMELRASVLGMTGDELKEQLRTKSFNSIIRQHGFRSMKAFQAALSGKTKDELRRRGWSDQKIEQFISKRMERLQKHHSEQ